MASNENFVRKLNLKINLTKLNSELESLRQDTPFHPDSNQIGLNHRRGARNPFYDNVGATRTKDGLICETDFSVFNAALSGSYFEYVYNSVWEFLALPVGRARLIRLNPKACMSVHYDLGFRFHIALHTNPRCFMIFDGIPCQHIPADGHLYWTNTTHVHTALNGDADGERIHLVFSEDCSRNMTEMDRKAFLDRIFGA